MDNPVHSLLVARILRNHGDRYKEEPYRSIPITTKDAKELMEAYDEMAEAIHNIATHAYVLINSVEDEYAIRECDAMIAKLLATLLCEKKHRKFTIVD